ncbi:MAG: RnfABCDGE type electron transport complex subunit A [Clostridia bacterium]|nr:RnfABCDGE type electron transport complex subunit A [Clostridia bacterium]
MKTVLLTLLTTALINNVVLSQFLGLCPFLGVSKNVKTAAGMGAAVIFVITVSSALTGALYNGVLVPLGLTFMETIVFILVIAALVQFVEMALKKLSPALYSALGVYLPLITTNCAVLGVALKNVQEGHDLLTGVLVGFGTSAGFAVAIIIMAGLRERMAHNAVPKAFRGMPLVLATACLMAIAFSGFSGLQF